MNSSTLLQKFSYFLTLVVAVTVMSCGGKKSSDEDESDNSDGSTTTTTTTATGTAATVDMANGATIAGTIKIDGAVPANKPIKMDADPYCKSQHTTGANEDHWVVTNGNVTNAFVYVKDGLGGKTYAAPADAITLSQKGCKYQPHVFGIMSGQTLKIANMDQTLHNVHSHGEKNEAFNEGQPQGTPAKEKKMDKVEVMVPIKCDVHGWMNCYAGVLNHPFFAVSDANGHYEIKGVPAGDYTVEAWHETTKADGKGVTQDQKVTVAAKDNKTVDFTLKAE